MKWTLKDFVQHAYLQGLIKYDLKGTLSHAPIAQFPYVIDDSLHELLTQLTQDFQHVAFRVSRDLDFLKENLQFTAASDPFVQRLLQMSDASRNSQEHQLLISRNDYFLQPENNHQYLQPKQVELNTIAVSFPYLAGQVTQWHQMASSHNPSVPMPFDNPVFQETVDALKLGLDHYDHPKAALLMVTQPGENNIFDQRALEVELWKQYQIPTVRASLETIAEEASLKDGHLWIHGYAAGLAYFRAAYDPSDFQSEAAWKGREKIAHAAAIEIPNVPMQLAGLKKIQQLLTQREILQNYTQSIDIKKVENCFVNMYDPAEVLTISRTKITAREHALAHPGHYVLKPQREGGGHNYYGAELSKMLQELSPEQQAAYILMERIRPETRQNTLILQESSEQGLCASEVGRYGVCWGIQDQIALNKDIGYLVRTKFINQNEGGVSAGYACLNSLAQGTS